MAGPLEIDVGGAAGGAAAGTMIAPGVGTVIGAGIGAIGSIMQSSSSAKQAKAQMAFQERMASTQHQREVADLRAAGLNPILSGTGGMGSAAPTGAQPGQVPNVLAESVSTALNAHRAQAEVANLHVDTRRKEQERDTAFSQEMLNKALRTRTIWEGERTRHEAEAAEARASREVSDWDIDKGWWNRWMRRIQPSLNSADVGSRVIGNLKPGR